MKIKKVEDVDLIDLVNYIHKNNIKNKTFSGDTGEEIEVKKDGTINTVQGFNDDSVFTLEVEEEITEDTEVPTLVMFYENRNFRKVCRFEDNVSISDFQFHEHEVVLAYYILNDDLTMTLIWRDGKLVE